MRPVILIIVSIALGGCVGSPRFCAGEHNGGDFHSYLRSGFNVLSDEAREWGEKYKRKPFYAESTGCPDELLSIPEKTTAVYLTGWFHDFNERSYEHVTMLYWDMWCTWRSHENCPLKKQGLTDEEIVVKMLQLLARFPNLEHLELDLRWPSGRSNLLQIPLVSLVSLKKLSFLKINAQGCIVLGFHGGLSRMKTLRCLMITGDPTWLSAGGEGDDIADAVIVPSFLWLRDIPVEELDLTGSILLEQDSLADLKHVKNLTPPIYYSLRDVPRSVEEIDTTQSEAPIDGYADLVKLYNLKKIIVYREDERVVRKLLKDRNVAIEVAEPYEHNGRERWRRWK